MATTLVQQPAPMLDLVDVNHRRQILIDTTGGAKRKRAGSMGQPLEDQVAFDAKIHLNFKPPSKILTMKDIGFPDDKGVSSVAVSEAFQLFTSDAIKQMRAEVLSKDVMDNCQYSSNLAQCQLRGFASE